MNIKTLIAAAITTAVASAAFAQTPAPGTNTPIIEKRAANQEKRIEAGEKSGALTAKEAATVEKRQAKLEGNIAAAKADGTVTAKERAKLTHEENRNSKVIHHKKHNAKTDAPATPAAATK
jgi:uncharacterized membrane protein YebE (DUF533 family)